ncbi:MAG: septal ring lytic transglycosylase RlpA family protein [Alphaproteobacteria bacterium]|nr:septal ring lytic transglycosylase RlpA family protein [Alphaproteobacteria bacterium]
MHLFTLPRLSIKILPAFLCALLFLSGCTELELASHVAKKGQGTSQGTFKVGSPYRVGGQWYNPTETYDYTQTGIASWYGPGFHGKKTANGETFNMNELTAAHKTLQMPSLVRVTNLENGRSIIVRINDRGPFSRGRVIDMSKKSAELLGFKNKGTAKVRLQVLTEESKAIAMAAKEGQSTKGYEVAMNNQGQSQSASQPPAQIMSPAASPVPAVEEADIQTQIPGHVRAGRFYPDPIVQQFSVPPTSIFVQVGSFSDSANANKLSAKLQSFGSAHVSPALVSGRNFYRVRFGPLGSVQQADSLLTDLVRAGYGDAMTIVD